MLVLTRNSKESILIGKKGDVLDGPIEVMLLNIRSLRSARIGVIANSEIVVRRKEIDDGEK